MKTFNSIRAFLKGSAVERAIYLKNVGNVGCSNGVGVNVASLLKWSTGGDLCDGIALLGYNLGDFHFVKKKGMLRLCRSGLSGHTVNVEKGVLSLEGLWIKKAWSRLRKPG